MPGASAQAEYERRRARRLARAQAAGQEAGEAPPHELAWLQGAGGERRLGDRLNTDAGLVGGVAVLHDLAPPGKRANIDHVVVGPAGVTVIDAKTLSGRVWVGREVIGQGRYGRRKPITDVRRQVVLVRAALAARGFAAVPVAGVVCLVNGGKGLDEMQWVREVGVAAPTPASRHAMRPGTVTPAQVRAVDEALAAAFLVRGGRRSVAVDAARPPVVFLPPVPAVAGPWASAPEAPGGAGAGAAQPAPRATTRRRRWLLFAVLAALVLLALAGTLAGRDAPAPISLTRTDVDARLPALRALAADAAGGAVRGPRVRATERSFVLTFRRGDRCRVQLRLPRGDASAAPAVRRERCGS